MAKKKKTKIRLKVFSVTEEFNPFLGQIYTIVMEYYYYKRTLVKPIFGDNYYKGSWSKETETLHTYDPKEAAHYRQLMENTKIK